MDSENQQKTSLVPIEGIPACQHVLVESRNGSKLDKETVFLEEVDGSYGMGHVSNVRCSFCLKSFGLLVDETFHPLDDFLYDTTKDTNGWLKIQTEWDRRVLFTLSQIIYKDYEEPDETLLEVEFAFPKPTDIVKLLWVDRQPVGFYSIKLKGTFDAETFSCYAMTTLDTLFIRTQFRRKGWGYSALNDFLNQFPNENIGFSYPISNSMKKLLRKHLEMTPSDRIRIWEVTGCGASDWDIRNCWLILTIS